MNEEAPALEADGSRHPTSKLWWRHLWSVARSGEELHVGREQYGRLLRILTDQDSACRCLVAIVAVLLLGGMFNMTSAHEVWRMILPWWFLQLSPCNGIQHEIILDLCVQHCFE
jgi:hypothetical protein